MGETRTTKAHGKGGTRVHATRRAISIGAAALLALGSLAADAWDLGPGRGGPFDQPATQGPHGPWNDAGSSGSNSRFGAFGTPRLERQSRFYEPGEHRVSGFDQAPTASPGRSIHTPGGRVRGR
jgi:hypothetical protein